MDALESCNNLSSDPYVHIGANDDSIPTSKPRSPHLGAGYGHFISTESDP